MTSAIENNTEIKSSNSRLSAKLSSTRQTPNDDFGSVMAQGATDVANVMVNGMSMVAPFVPGGAIVSAAVSGFSGALGPTVNQGGHGGTGAASYGASQGFQSTAMASQYPGSPLGGTMESIYGVPSSVTRSTGTVSGFSSQSYGLSAAGSGPAGNYGSSATSGPVSVPVGTSQVSGFVGATPVTNTVGATTGATDSFNQMMSATRQMTEFQASFNLQYLQLQEKIQIDTRQFNLVSNIMKTKHDAAKNALNNVR